MDRLNHEPLHGRAQRFALDGRPVAVTPPLLFDLASGGREQLLPNQGSALLYRGVLSPEAADQAMETLVAKVPWQQHHVRVFGRDVPQPRLVAWFGDPDRRYTYSGLTLEPLRWTEPLTALRSRCEELADTRFNSGLANLYRDGKDSVAWHADDEPELGVDPIIASVSLGAERRFDLRNKHTGEIVKTLLPTGSVVVMSHGCQEHWLHQVPKMLRVPKQRINVTFRTMVL